MTRPQIIRADTIDLQSQDAPSAKDHSRQPTHPGQLGDGPPAPHQAVALKHAEKEVEFHPRSPRHSQDLSNKELQLLHEDSDSFDSTNPTLCDQDLHNLQRHGNVNGANGEEMEMGDGEGDDGLDDDMMDKISSSPSIEDGGYSLPLPWPLRDDSHLSLCIPEEDAAPPPPIHQFLSSTPFLSPPAQFPLFHPQKELDLDLDPLKDHHQGGYADDTVSLDSELDHDGHPTESRVGNFQEEFDLQDSDDVDFDAADFHNLLLPADDSLLDNSFDEIPLSPSSSTSSSEDRSPNEDDDAEVSFRNDSRSVDSGWGGECLRDTEDIDFDFVYALHTFVATVEGQANATKGDTMVLLDDTNSYWWLVRVVKDSSIGYLPAEHIETPTERLARLNKHRNIGLSQTMLGDNQDKPKNPLKKAMRRRNGKTVQFAAPTYHEASDVDYSTEEEEEVEGEYSAQIDGDDSQDQEQQVDRKDTIDSSKGIQEGEVTSVNESRVAADSRDNDVDQNTLVNSERTSDETSEPSDEGSTKSRKGTVRNTDSFFKDDSVETRKINLTPSLLRDDDSSGSTIKSIDAKELKTRPSLDSLEKAQLPSEKVKEDKKRNQKKGMLSGLFKRKDKKHRGQEDDTEDYEKLSEESPRDSSQPMESSESSSQEAQAPKSASQQPQRQSSKLQKSPPAKLIPGKPPHRVEQKGALVEQSTTGPQSDKAPPVAESRVHTSQAQPEITRPGNDLAVQRVMSPEQSSEDSIEPPNGTRQETRVSDESSESPRGTRQETRFRDGTSESPKGTRQDMFTRVRDGTSESPKGTRHELYTPATDISYESKPEKLKIPNQRMPLDEFDSSPDTAEPPISLVQKDQGLVKTEASKERLSESPVQVDLPDRVHTQNPPRLVVDTSSQEDPSASPVSPSSSPEIIEAPLYNDREETPASTSQSPSITPTWSDASLRAYLEDDGDIRDLLVVVHDKSNVKPADPNHPLVKNLFKEESRKLGEISNQLDSLLGDWLARKSKPATR